MKCKIIIAAVILTACMGSFVDGGSRRRWRGGSGGHRTIVINRGGGNSTGAALGGLGVGLIGGTMLGAAVANSNNNAKAEVAELRRDLERDKLESLRRENAKEIDELRRDNNEAGVKKRTRDDSASREETRKLRRNRRLNRLENKLEKLENKREKLEHRLDDLGDGEHSGRGHAKKEAVLKKQIEKVNADIKAVETQIDELD